MRRALIASVAVCCLVASSALAQHAAEGTMRPYEAVPFLPDNDVPCLMSALEAGSPQTGPSTWILKAPPTCVVPWHSHTAQEQLIVVAGDVTAEMTGHAPTRLGPGGFAIMDGGMAHQFTCRSREACVMFVTFDRAYDIKWGKGRP